MPLRTDEFKLDRQGRNDFEENQIDSFKIYGPSLDTISEIHIQKKKSSLHPVDDKWHLEWIKIQRPDNPDVMFHYNDWIKNEKIVIAWNSISNS